MDLILQLLQVLAARKKKIEECASLMRLTKKGASWSNVNISRDDNHVSHAPWLPFSSSTV